MDFLGKSLRELWISYNEIEKLDGLKSLVKLEKLYIGNNHISKIDELNNLANLPELKDVVFKGNPFTLENPSLWTVNHKIEILVNYILKYKKDCLIFKLLMEILFKSNI